MGAVTTTAGPQIRVDDLLGISWVAGGRRMPGGFYPLTGIDCWGVVVEARRRAGLWTPDPWGCGPQPVAIHPEGLPDDFLRHLVPITEPKAYCVVKLRSRWPGGHAGVYLPDGTILQTHQSAGVVRTPIERVRRNVLAYYDVVRDA